MSTVTMADTLTITDNRTGKQYEIPIKDGVIRATDLRQVKAGTDDPGLMTYDPAFMNTAACRSKITFIDGDKGILEYRGYPIEQLAERATYLETAYLIIFGALPTAAQVASLTRERTGPAPPRPLRPAPAGSAAGIGDARHQGAHDAAGEHQEADGRLPVRRPSD